MSSGLPALLLIGLAAAFAVASYLIQGVPPRRLWPAVAGRAVAWSTVILLALNPACVARGTAEQPLVLLDTSLSLAAAGGDLAAARGLADSLGEVRPFGSSRLRAPLISAAASGRPVVVVTDGEVRDAAELPPDLLAATGIRLLPRRPVNDLAITRLTAPRWVQAGDTLSLQVELEAFGDLAPRPVPIEIRSEGRSIGLATLELGDGGRGQATINVATAGLTPGPRVLDAVLVDHQDAEPRTDRRQLLVTITPSPGIVLVAATPGWESRFLFHTIRDLAGVPVRGYLQLEPDTWRQMDGLAAVSRGAVADAVRRADLLVSFGDPVPGLPQAETRGHWEWPGASPVAGDWFISPVPGAPTAAGLGAIPAESLPPAIALAALEPPPAGWVGMRAQLSRRGAERAAVVGEIRGTQRKVTVGAAGLWRWSFRGGLAEQAYRIWVSESLTWLLGGAPAGAATVRPLQPVVEQDEPLVFEQVDTASDFRVAVEWTSGEDRRLDTLAFDGSGRARLTLPPGVWKYRAGPADSGVVVVEEYSAEFLPGSPLLEEQHAGLAPSRPRHHARDLPWLFAIPILAWCLEWWTRRRSGLR